MWRREVTLFDEARIPWLQPWEVQGCGTDVTVPILMDHSVTHEEAEALQEALEQVKAESIANDECMDTDDIIQEALKRVKISYVEYSFDYIFEF